MREIWILVADAAIANIYSTTNLHDDSHLSLIKEFKHPESRMKTSDLVSDRTGRYMAGDKAHGTYSEQTSPKEVEADRFAMELAHTLKSAQESNHFDQLIIVAPAHFHGLLKKHFSDQLRKKIKHHIEKDYTKVPPHLLMVQLQSHLGN